MAETVRETYQVRAHGALLSEHSTRSGAVLALARLRTQQPDLKHIWQDAKIYRTQLREWEEGDLELP